MKNLLECATVNLFDKDNIDIVALHETGHVIVMYALGLMDAFEYVTRQANTGNGTLGLTETTEDYKAELRRHQDKFANLDLLTGKGIADCVRLSRLESAKLYLPNICRLFGGGAICRYYKAQNEEMCKIDYDLIDLLLAGLGLAGTRETVLTLVDNFLNTVFVSLDLLTKTIYVNLKEEGTLNKEQVMEIIRQWEEFKI